MSVRKLTMAAALALAAPAAADAAPPKPIADAIALAQPYRNARFAFTLRYEDLSEATPKTYVVRFDPRRPRGARWSPVEPAAAALSKDEKRRLEELQKSDQADDAFIYDKLGEGVGALALTSSAGGKATYTGAAADPGMPKSMRGAVEMTIVVDVASNAIETVEVRSLRPFKPAPVAKVEHFMQTMRYAPLAGLGAPALVEQTAQSRGEAMFQKFNTSTRFTYSNVERVDAEPFDRPPPREVRPSAGKSGE